MLAAGSQSAGESGAAQAAPLVGLNPRNLSCLAPYVAARPTVPIPVQRACPRPVDTEASVRFGHSDQPVAGFAVSSRHVHGNVVTIYLFGELDLSSVPVLHDALATLRVAGPDPARRVCTTVRVDLSGLAFLDCTGLTALLDTRTALTDLGWLVDLGDPRGCVAQFLGFADALGFLPPEVRWPLPLQFSHWSAARSPG